MIKQLVSSAGLFSALFLISCNNTGGGSSGCKLTSKDSENIYKAWGKRSVFSRIGSGGKDSNGIVQSDAFTKPITDSEARAYVLTYGKSPLEALKTSATNNPDSLVYIRAFELDKMVIDTVRNHPEIWGLRLYLGKRPDSMYTLVIVPKDKSNENITGKNLMFDWNNPCPPYCPPKALEFPK